MIPFSANVANQGTEWRRDQLVGIGIVVFGALSGDEQQAVSLEQGEKGGDVSLPLRVSHDLTDRQRQILHFLPKGERWRLRDILEQLPEPPAPRTLRDDLRFLKRAGLVDSGGRSVAARWWLKYPGRES